MTMQFLRKTVPILGLAALGLIAALPGQAQSLTLSGSDTITVDSTGTHGIINNIPVNNGTTTYGDTGGSVISRVVQTSGASAFTLGDGGVLADTVGGDALYASGSGPITIRGGSISTDANFGTGLSVQGSGMATASGGVISGGQIGFASGGSGMVTVSGGTISATGPYGTAFYSDGSGAVAISGGAISTVERGIYAGGTGVVTVIGGTISDGLGVGLYTFGSGVIDLFSQGGAPFLINGVSMNNMAVPSGAVGAIGTIFGTLLNGDALDTRFEGYGTINLNVGIPPAPEPSQPVVLAIGLLALSGLVLKARKRGASVTRAEARG